MSQQEKELTIVEELRESAKKYGQIRPVIRTQFGIAGGNNRKKADPNWKEDYKEVADYLEHLKLEVADNIHEQKSPQWWTEKLRKAAQFLETEKGVPKGQIAAKLANEFSISKSRVYRNLPKEFLDENKATSPGRPPNSVFTVKTPESPVSQTEPDLRQSDIYKKYGVERLAPGLWRDSRGEPRSQAMIETDPNYRAARREIEGRSIVAEVKQATAALEAVKPTPEETEQHRYGKGASQAMGELTKKSDNKYENSLQTLLAPYVGELNAHFGEDNTIVVALEEEAKSYHPDCLLDNFLIIEVEGKGSASAANPEREQALMKLGYRLVHLKNRVVTDPDMQEALVQLARICVEQHRQEVAA